MVDILTKARKIRSSLLARAKRTKVCQSAIDRLCEDTPDAQTLVLFLEKWDGKCYYFGSNISIAKCHIDHKIPISRGGTNDLFNLAITCPQANLSKGDMTEKEFKALIRVISKFEDKGWSVLSRLRQGFFTRRKKG